MFSIIPPQISRCLRVCVCVYTPFDHHMFFRNNQPPKPALRCFKKRFFLDGTILPTPK